MTWTPDPPPRQGHQFRHHLRHRAFGLARKLGSRQAEARAYIAAYFERYPGIRDYMEGTKLSAREDGYVETLFGRRVHIRGINDKNPAARNFAERRPSTRRSRERPPTSSSAR